MMKFFYFDIQHSRFDILRFSVFDICLLLITSEPCLWGRSPKGEAPSAEREAPNPEPILKFSSNWF